MLGEPCLESGEKSGILEAIYTCSCEGKLACFSNKLKGHFFSCMNNNNGLVLQSVEVVYVYFSYINYNECFASSVLLHVVIDPQNKVVD